MMMRMIYFKILAITLSASSLCCAQPGDGGCSIPKSGNWIQVFYEGTPWPTKFSSFDYGYVKSTDYNCFKYGDSSMVDFLGSFGFKPISLDYRDTIDIQFQTCDGKVILKLVNQNVLSDTVPNLFFLSDLPRIPGSYIIDVHKNLKEHFAYGHCGYNITPEYWHKQLIESDREISKCKCQLNNSLIISYNYDFETPLDQGQYISFDAGIEKNYTRPYIVIENYMDSLLKFSKDQLGNKKIEKPWEFFYYKVMVYTDQGAYELIIYLKKNEYDIHPDRLNNCYFLVISDIITEISTGIAKIGVEISDKTRSSFYIIDGVCCKKFMYYYYKD